MLGVALSLIPMMIYYIRVKQVSHRFLMQPTKSQLSSEETSNFSKPFETYESNWIISTSKGKKGNIFETTN